MEDTIVMSPGYWMNSQFSVARHFGGCTINGKQYLVIEQTNDLVRRDFVKYYQRLGQKKFMAILKANKGTPAVELKLIMKNIQTDYKPVDNPQTVMW